MLNLMLHTVEIINAATVYGSAFAPGLLSSIYPYPLITTGRGILIELPLLASPTENSCIADVP